MAKSVGIIGTSSGRLGNTVLSKGNNGETIARTYQSQVRNPRTIDQRKQRAKMNLAGQISKLVPASALVGFHQGSNRNNRSAFVSSLLNACTVATDSNGDYQATLVPELLTFASGNVNTYHGRVYDEMLMDYVDFDMSSIPVYATLEHGFFHVVLSYYYPPVWDLEDFLKAVEPKGIYGHLAFVLFFPPNDSLPIKIVHYAAVFYDTELSASYLSATPWTDYSMPTSIKGTKGDRRYYYVTPFIINNNSRAFVGDIIGIDGNNIQASLKQPVNFKTVADYYQTYDKIPFSIIERFLASPETRFGNSRYTGFGTIV